MAAAVVAISERFTAGLGPDRHGAGGWSRRSTTGRSWPTGWSRSGHEPRRPPRRLYAPRERTARAHPGMTTVVHLTASTFYGGPERQMLGLARALSPEVRTVFLSFAEGGRCGDSSRRPEARASRPTLWFTTRLTWAAIRELTGRLLAERADVLCVHGYKAGLLGRFAARRAGIPVIAVSRGWTYESTKVRLYETARPAQPAVHGPGRLRLAGAGGEGPEGGRAGSGRSWSSPTRSTRRGSTWSDPTGAGRAREPLLRAGPADRRGRGTAEPGERDSRTWSRPPRWWRRPIPTSASSSSATACSGPRSRPRSPRGAWPAGSSWPASAPTSTVSCPPLDLLVQSSYTEGMPNVDPRGLRRRRARGGHRRGRDPGDPRGGARGTARPSGRSPDLEPADSGDARG